jgi:hypothetical protein
MPIVAMLWHCTNIAGAVSGGAIYGIATYLSECRNVKQVEDQRVPCLSCLYGTVTPAPNV